MTITYPSKQSEFEIHAYLWNELRKLGLDVRGEVEYVLPYLKKTRSARIRFDLVRFEDEKAVMLIEVKDSPRPNWDNTRQGRRYLSFGISVLLICGMEEAVRYVKEIGLP